MAQSPRPHLPFKIIHEDDDLVVVDKPAGLLTSTVPREPRTTAFALLREYVKQREPRARVGVIHRLDRDASGLLVFSKNERTYRALKDQFFHHTVDRVYLAIVRGKLTPTSGRIETWLTEMNDGSVRSNKNGPGERAISDYVVTRVVGDVSLVRVTLLTGRKHQIRVHMLGRGAAVVGDPVYNPKDKAERLMLAAVELGFDHPSGGKHVHFKIPLPPPMKKLLKSEEDL